MNFSVILEDDLSYIFNYITNEKCELLNLYTFSNKFKISLIVNSFQVGNHNRYIYIRKYKDKYQLLCYNNQIIFNKLFNITDILPNEIFYEIVKYIPQLRKVLTLLNRKMNSLFNKETFLASEIKNYPNINLKKLIYDRDIIIPRNLEILEFQKNGFYDLSQLKNLKELIYNLSFNNSDLTGIPNNLESCNIKICNNFKEIFNKLKSCKKLKINIEYLEENVVLHFTEFHKLEKLIICGRDNEDSTGTQFYNPYKTIFNSNLKELSLEYYDVSFKLPPSLEKLIILSHSNLNYCIPINKYKILHYDKIEEIEEKNSENIIDLRHLVNLKQLEFERCNSKALFPENIEFLRIRTSEKINSLAYCKKLKEFYIFFDEYENNIELPDSLEITNYVCNSLPKSIKNILWLNYSKNPKIEYDFTKHENLEMFSIYTQEVNKFIKVNENVKIIEDCYYPLNLFKIEY